MSIYYLVGKTMRRKEPKLTESNRKRIWYQLTQKELSDRLWTHTFNRPKKLSIDDLDNQTTKEEIKKSLWINR